MTNLVKEDLVSKEAFQVLKSDMLKHIETFHTLPSEEQKDICKAFALQCTQTEYLTDSDKEEAIKDILFNPQKVSERMGKILKYSESFQEFVFLVMFCWEADKILSLSETLPFPFNQLRDIIK